MKENETEYENLTMRFYYDKNDLSQKLAENKKRQN